MFIQGKWFALVYEIHGKPVISNRWGKHAQTWYNKLEQFRHSKIFTIPKICHINFFDRIDHFHMFFRYINSYISGHYQIQLC